MTLTGSLLDSGIGSDFMYFYNLSLLKSLTNDSIFSTVMAVSNLYLATPP